MRRTITTVVAGCDVSHCRAEFSPDEEPITVTLHGGGYGTERRPRVVVLDLCPVHREQWSLDISGWLAVHTSGRKAEAASAGAMDDGKRAEIRAWATATGVEMPARGKIPKHVVEAYETAHEQRGAA